MDAFINQSNSCMKYHLILVGLVGLCISQIYISNLDGVNNNTKTNSIAYGLAWMNYTSTTNLDFRVSTTLQNITSIFINVYNATNGSFTTISVWNQFVNFNFLPPRTLTFNISKFEEIQLIARNWTVYVASPTWLNGEISGKLSLAVPPPENILPEITWKTWLTLSLIIVMLIVLAFDYFEPWFIIFLNCMIMHIFGILSIHEMQESFSQERNPVKSSLYSDVDCHFSHHLCGATPEINFVGFSLEICLW